MKAEMNIEGDPSVVVTYAWDSLDMVVEFGMGGLAAQVNLRQLLFEGPLDVSPDDRAAYAALLRSVADKVAAA